MRFIPSLFFALFFIIGCATIGCKTTTPIPPEYSAAADAFESALQSNSMMIHSKSLLYGKVMESLKEFRESIKGAWNDKIIPFLRTTYDYYEELRASGIGLPRLPDFIEQMLRCPPSPKPPSLPDASTAR